MAVKPNIMSSVLKEIKAEVTSNKLLISIAAGVSIDDMERVKRGPKVFIIMLIVFVFIYH